MIKRIEFTLNLDDPREAAIYDALKPSLHYRRAGAIIRQALDVVLLSNNIQMYQMLHLPKDKENCNEQA